MRMAREYLTRRNNIHLIRKRVISILFAGFLAGFCAAAEVDVSKLVEFRDERIPFEVAGVRYPYEVKPWKAPEKKLFLFFFGFINSQAPGLMERATAYRPIRLYRATGLELPRAASAFAPDNSITICDKAIHDIADMDSFGGSAALTSHIVIHELVHLADPFDQVGKGKAWIDLVRPRLDQVHQGFFKQTGVSAPSGREGEVLPDEHAAIMDKLAFEQGLPTGYAGTNLVEALAETTALIALPKEWYTPPAKIKAFIQSELLSVPYAPEESLRHVHEGFAALEQNRADDALRAFSRAIELDPGLAQAYLRRAELWLARKEHDKAIADYTEVIDRYGPVYLAAFDDRGDIHVARGEYDKAAADFTAVIQIDPSDAMGWLSRGYVWAHKNEHDKAIADFSECIKLEPSEPQPYALRAEQWMAKGEFDRAIADYTRAIEIDHEMAGAYLFRGLAWRMKQDVGKAIADFSEAIRLQPDDFMAYGSRADLHFFTKQYDKAIDDYGRVLELVPNNPPLQAGAYLWRGKAWHEKRNFDKAIADYTAVIELTPHNLQAYAMRAMAWDKKKEYDKAIVDYGKLIELDMDPMRRRNTYLQRAYCFQAKKDYEKAIADCDRAIELDSNYILAYTKRAYIFVLKKEYDKAIADCDKLIELDPKDMSAYMYRAYCFKEEKDYDKAIADYGKWIELDPKQRGAYTSRAHCFKAKKDYGKALADYDNAISLSPEYASAYNSRAWLLAVCPDPKYRDGKRAVESGTKACELTKWEKANYIGTLAAAYAEAGNFEKAVEFQAKAIEAATGGFDKEGAQERLDLYKAKKPYRLEE